MQISELAHPCSLLDFSFALLSSCTVEKLGNKETARILTN